MNYSEENRLDYNLIPVLIAIVETGSMVAAAEALNVAPSAISYTVKKLRTHYNDPLFIRALNGVRPTALAQNLYAQFKTINEHIITTFQTRSSPETTPRKLYLQAEPLAELWATSRLLHNDIISAGCVLSFKNGALSQDERLYKLRNQEVDIDIGLILPGDRNIITKTLFEWKYILICAENNKTFGRNLSREDFLKASHIAYNSLNYSTIMSYDMGELLNERKVEPTVTSESSINMLFTLLLSDFLMIIPDIYYRMLKNTLPVRRVHCDFMPESGVKVFAHLHKKKMSDALISHVIETLQFSENGGLAPEI
ncbi:TPA: LysR family transcriptional regulator [Enterobacter cloacae]